MSRLFRAGCWGTLLGMCILPAFVSGEDHAPRINEFMASNASTFQDGNGQYPDWVEIHNPGSIALNLGGYYLTDNADDLTKWRIPSLQIPANGYLLIMASAPETDQGVPIPDFVDPDGWAHAPFKLEADGEYLALVDPDGVLPLHEFSPEYPKQRTDVSYGYEEDGNVLAYFDRPTPGAPNGTGFPGVVADTTFSVDRGFYDQPISVAVTSETPAATIYFTLDGREPGPGSGSVYQGPIAIDRTTTLRAKAYREGLLPTNVDTHTYLFPEDVLRQPPDPEGYPAHWGTDSEVPGLVVADYEMDPRVVDSTMPGYSAREALLDIPTLSIVMDPGDFLGADTGIYNHPKNRGDTWEKACSMELILPNGEEGFQVNAQIEIHGNSSRRPWRMQKHSFRVSFVSRLGPARLEYPWFPGSPVQSFDELVLRACFTDSWGLVSWAPGRYRPNDSQYIRDVWMKESLRDMGQPSSYGSFVHLYVNGLYWGLYNPTERLEVEFFTDHFGGREQDWRVIEDFGNSSSGWLRMFLIARADPESFETFHGIQRYLDVTNFADYMLLHFYADAEDWPHHNGYAARRVGEPFRFFVWDQEIVLDNHRMQRYDAGQTETPGELFQLLRRNTAFRMLFADRVQKHLFNGGALSLEASQGRYRQLADRIDKALVAESARWGDTQASTPYGNSIEQPSNPDDLDDLNYPPAPHGPDYYFTREDSWVVERDNVLNHYLPEIYNPENPNSLLRELRSENLFPLIDAPTFNRHGGSVAPGFELQLTAPEGKIYYTLDGSDPRLAAPQTEATVLLEEFSPAKARVPTDSTLEEVWFRSDYNDESWTAGTSGVGYETNPADYRDVIQLEVPEMYQGPTSVYVRMPFEVSESELEGIARLVLNIKFDDGFAAYLNGTRVASANAPSALAWDSSATQSHSDSSAVGFVSFDISAFADLLVPGENLLAIQGLNVQPGSSDLLILPQLEAHPSLAPQLSPQAFEYTRAVTLTHSVTVRARAFDGAEWSALNEAGFITDQSGFSGDPQADLDGDGLPALLEYALGTSDTDPRSGANVFEWQIGASEDPAENGTFVYLSYTKAPGTTDATLILQTTVDLNEWTDEGQLIFIEEQPLAQDRVRRVYRSQHPLERLPHLFMRLKGELE